LPHIWKNGHIGLEGLPAFTQLLGAAFGDADRVATAEWRKREIKPKNDMLSQYYAEFEDVAADLDRNLLALWNTLRIVLSEARKDSFTYRDMPDELHAFVTVCQTQDNYIRQRRAEKEAQNKGGVSCAFSPEPPVPPRDPAAAPAVSVAVYTRQAPFGASTGNRRVSEEARAKRFEDGRCLYCVGFNHGAAECAARKKTQTIKVVGAVGQEVRTRTGSEESGKDQLN